MIVFDIEGQLVVIWKKLSHSDLFACVDRKMH